jgi:large subunit ribosomal protein L18Ae
VTGRKIPSDNDPEPQIYRMRVFAKDPILAKSRFWHFLKKVKSTHGEILGINEIFEKKTSNVKNYGVVIRYRSLGGIHNMYKEYRDISVCGAISQMYMEMSGRHRAVHDTIHIVKIVRLKDSEVKRLKTAVYTNSKAKFPKVEPSIGGSTRANRSTFVASRPTTMFQ